MIRMVTERGRSGPCVFCDHCDERIVGEGNYQWLVKVADAADHPAVWFTHKACSQAFERSHPEPAGWYWGAMEIDVFPIYLEHNLKTQRKKALERAKFFATHF